MNGVSEVDNDDMAFQMIPPRVSSSPPPLDSLPDVTSMGEDDDDEEFGTFSTHNSFDITGLSDKLPPTPESSPSKFPNIPDVDGNAITAVYDGVQNTAVKGDSGADSATCEARSSPSCPSAGDKTYGECISSGEFTSVSEIRDDTRELDDSSSYASNITTGEPPVLKISNQTDNDKIETGDINSSQESECNLGSEIPNSSPNNSINSYSLVATPPPLDHVADSLIIDDEFSRISPSSPVIDDDDDEDEFGDFTTCSFEISEASALSVNYADKVDVVSSSKTVIDKELTVPDKRPESDVETTLSVERHLERNKDAGVVGSSQKLSTVDSEASGSLESSSEKNKRVLTSDSVGNDHALYADRTKKAEDAGESKSIRKDTNAFVQNNNDSDSQREKDGSTHLQFPSSELTVGSDTVSDCSTSKSNCSPSKSNLALKDKVEQDVNEPRNIQSCSAQNLDNTDTKVSEERPSDVKDISRDKFDSVKFSESDISACTSSKDVVISSSSSIRTEGNNINSDVPSKGLDNAGASETKNDDVDDESVESNGDSDFGEFGKAGGDEEEDDDLDFGDLREQVRSGTFGLEVSPDSADEFGDFYEYDETHARPTLKEPSIGDEQFGNFETTADEVTEEADEFGDFTNVGSEDNFGEFASPERDVCVSKGSDQEDDDEFGDFTSQRNAEPQSGNSKLSYQEPFAATSLKDTPVLRKLESLVWKWVPRDPTTVSASAENSENQCVPTLSHSIEDDAFVWRQLQNLESSAALTLSWASTLAHTLYLSSVNVDARNILFGQKWSSSVPLFAQTLSFSPLTPAKPTENGGTLDGGNRGSVTPPILASAISPKFSSSFKKDEADVDIPPVNENTPEEQIPPAKFDWTSSGLTNPLEGPGLEREFLSEGEAKGAASSQMKVPPVPSPLVQQILGSGMMRPPSAATPLQSLSSDIREVVEHLPDIRFMRSMVLMFPIRGEE